MPAPGSQVVALDLIAAAMRLLGVWAAGESIPSAEAKDALATLNQMLDSWNADDKTIYTINRTLFTPLTLKQAYTLGTGGDFNIARPARLDYVSVQSLNNPAQPLEIPLRSLTDTEWEAIPVKNVSSALPTKYWDDGGFPLRTLSFFPIPSVQVNFIVGSWNALTLFADLSTTNYSFPPGYVKALKYNLALELAPEYPAGQRDMALVTEMARKSLAILKGNNLSLARLQMDGALSSDNGGFYNWLTDEPV